MNSKEAIKILEELKKKLESVDKITLQAWKSQATSHILVFFGRDSPEYQFLETFDYSNYGIGSTEWIITQSKPAFSTFINGCIENIRNFGIKKKEWKHILITTHPAIFWSIFSAALVFSFWLGGQLATNKSNQGSNKVPAYKNDSIQKK